MVSTAGLECVPFPVAFTVVRVSWCTEIILEGIKAIREALDVVSRRLPQDECTRREYAQRFLEATNDGMEAMNSSGLR